VYRNIPFWRFVLASVVVLIPAAVLEEQSEQWAWRYVGLILLMMVVTQFSELSAFQRFLSRELRG